MIVCTGMDYPNIGDMMPELHSIAQDQGIANEEDVILYRNLADPLSNYQRRGFE